MSGRFGVHGPLRPYELAYRTATSHTYVTPIERETSVQLGDRALLSDREVIEKLRLN